jgi:hypothetical protein
MMCLTAVRHRRAHWQMTRMLVDQALFGTASRDKTSEDDDNSVVCVGGVGGGGYTHTHSHTHTHVSGGTHLTVGASLKR